MFSKENSKSIIKLPLSYSLPPDIRFWRPCKNGEYYVKSAYLLGILGHTQELMEGLGEADREACRLF